MLRRRFWSFAAAGLLTAPFRHYRRGEQVAPDEQPFGCPLVVKPAREGSSVGVSIVPEQARKSDPAASATIQGAERRPSESRTPVA